MEIIPKKYANKIYSKILQSKVGGCQTLKSDDGEYSKKYANKIFKKYFNPRLVAVRRRKLMENPHYEGGSQDEVVILASESKV